MIQEIFNIREKLDLSVYYIIPNLSTLWVKIFARGHSASPGLKSGEVTMQHFAFPILKSEGVICSINKN